MYDSSGSGHLYPRGGQGGAGEGVVRCNVNLLSHGIKRGKQTMSGLC